MSANAVAGAAAAVLAPRPLLAHFGGVGAEPLPPIQDDKVKELALRAIAASRAAGADYADVRLTHTRRRGIHPDLDNTSDFVTDREDLHVGVRALVGGIWGFASSAVWSPDEVVRLGREAVAQAQAIAGLGQSRPVSLAPVTPVVDGHWATPVKRDPFEVSPFEIMDVLHGLKLYERQLVRPASPLLPRVLTAYQFSVQAKAFASTDGSYCTQQLYRSEPLCYLMAWRRELEIDKSVRIDLHNTSLLATGGVGWEVWRDQPIREAMWSTLDTLDRELSLPLAAPEVGRYDVVVCPYLMAELVQATLGRPTELDRVLGYEANAGGTSYLNDPAAMINTYRIGTDLLTVTANRSELGGCATVRWDDEGVAPSEFTLVQKGMLADFQTTRESAAWLQDTPSRRQQPLRSYGCAHAPTGGESPLTHIPNLAVAPGPEALNFEELVHNLKDGIAIKRATLSTDFQGLNGALAGSREGGIYRVKGGQLVSRLPGATVLFRAPELWKSLLALGGAASVERLGVASTKGEPAQQSWRTVKTPPGLFKQLTTIDGRRR